MTGRHVLSPSFIFLLLLSWQGILPKYLSPHSTRLGLPGHILQYMGDCRKVSDYLSVKLVASV